MHGKQLAHGVVEVRDVAFGLGVVRARGNPEDPQALVDGLGKLTEDLNAVVGDKVERGMYRGIKVVV